MNRSSGQPCPLDFLLAETTAAIAVCNSEAQAKRAVGFQPVEPAPQLLSGAIMHLKLRSQRVRARSPSLSERRRLTRSPQAQHPSHARRQDRCEGLRRGRSVEARCGPPLDPRRFGEVHPEAGDDPVARPFEQDPSEFSSSEQQVVGPFEHQRRARHRRLDRLDQRQPAGERETRRGWVVGAKLDNRRSREIALE